MYAARLGYRCFDQTSVHPVVNPIDAPANIVARRSRRYDGYTALGTISLKRLPRLSPRFNVPSTRSGTNFCIEGHLLSAPAQP